MWYSSFAKSNAEADTLSPADRVVVSGGTQGIGAGIALRFALAGASCWIIGRSAQRGQEVVEKLQKASQEGQRRRKIQVDQQAAVEADHCFLQADLSDINEMKRVADQVSKRAGTQGVRWLFETQGGPPTGNAEDTPAGIDSAFAVQCLSRYALAKRLLEAGTVKNGICIIAAPGQGGKNRLNLDDIECKTKRSKYGLNMLPSAQRDATVLDAIAETFAERYPNITVAHMFPSIVGTNTAANQKFPFPFPQMLGLASYVVPSPGQYAEVPFYVHVHPEGAQQLRKGQANLLGPWLGRAKLSAHVDDATYREAIIKKLDSYGV